jgi:hypothetical protein
MSVDTEANGRDGSPSRPQQSAGLREPGTDASERRPYRALRFSIFAVAAAICLTFALYTNHVWEDYYITFRSSKNLATGHGLVFNAGERLHTFTSPIGVLLPALTSVVTLNRSDAAALWLFRALSIGAFALAATLLFSMVERAFGRRWLAMIAVAWIATDAKSIDFTINGMETGFLLLGLAWLLHLQFTVVKRRWLWLGLAWAALMWTRPDSFIYIGLISVSGWVFGQEGRGGVTRTEWMKTCAFAALVCTAAYLPWFAWSWWYYGTPVPHTVVAKAGLTADRARSLLDAARTLVTLPINVWHENATSLPGAFLPSYYLIGGWPHFLAEAAAVFAFIAAFAWLVPGIDARARVASAAFCGFQFYLTYYPYFPFPWYQPGATLLAAIALAGVVSRLSCIRKASTPHPALRFAGVTLAVALLGYNLWVTPAVARQAAAQQKWIENGNRRKIGEWLRANAKPGDSVFLEPLGYIGYFSNLVTYDFPGLSSRAVTDAIHAVGTEWAEVIHLLQPDWLVLRDTEIERLSVRYPSLLTSYYSPVQAFDVRGAVKQANVNGQPYLEVDAKFTVYHRETLNQRRYRNQFGETSSRYALEVLPENNDMMLIHAPGQTVVAIPPGAHRATVNYGFRHGAANGDVKTDGAIYRFYWCSGTNKQLVYARRLHPASVAEDRNYVSVTIDLPKSTVPAKLCVEIDPMNGTVNDWTCIGVTKFE